MLDFAIIGLPRSATTWAANWLTTDRSICLHDPLLTYTLDQLAEFRSPGKVCGVACTGLWQFPDWVARNVRTVLLIDRDPDAVNQSLVDIGLTPLPIESIELFLNMPGQRVDMGDLFDARCAGDIWHTLIPSIDHDAQRHELLTGFMVNPYFAGWEPEPTAVRDWARRIQEAAQL